MLGLQGSPVTGKVLIAEEQIGPDSPENWPGDVPWVCWRLLTPGPLVLLAAEAGPHAAEEHRSLLCHWRSQEISAEAVPARHPSLLGLLPIVWGGLSTAPEGCGQNCRTGQCTGWWTMWAWTLQVLGWACGWGWLPMWVFCSFRVHSVRGCWAFPWSV